MHTRRRAAPCLRTLAAPRAAVGRGPPPKEKERRRERALPAKAASAWPGGVPWAEQASWYTEKASRLGCGCSKPCTECGRGASCAPMLPAVPLGHEVSMALSERRGSSAEPGTGPQPRRWRRGPLTETLPGGGDRSSAKSTVAEGVPAAENKATAGEPAAPASCPSVALMRSRAAAATRGHTGLW